MFECFWKHGWHQVHHGLPTFPDISSTGLFSWQVQVQNLSLSIWQFDAAMKCSYGLFTAVRSSMAFEKCLRICQPKEMVYQAVEKVSVEAPCWQAELGACRMEKPNIGWTDAADLRHPADIKKIIKYEFVQMTTPVPAGTSKSTMSEVNRLFLFGSYHCITISAGLKKKKKEFSH